MRDERRVLAPLRLGRSPRRDDQDSRRHDLRRPREASGRSLARSAGVRLERGFGFFELRERGAAEATRPLADVLAEENRFASLRAAGRRRQKSKGRIKQLKSEVEKTNSDFDREK